ncbi:MAG: hypothetical protein ABI744_02740 [Chloroflexota bacterium]
MSWWAGKVRRFARYFTGRVSASERSNLSAWLTPAQLALYDSMQGADQRHGLDVVAALRGGGHAQNSLLLAGLLHDCGKGRGLHVWHRVGWSLGERYGATVEQAMEKMPTFHSAFATLREHAARSADLAAAAGCDAATVDLIRNQAEPTDPVLGRALLLADQAN